MIASCLCGQCTKCRARAATKRYRERNPNAPKEAYLKRRAQHSLHQKTRRVNSFKDYIVMKTRSSAKKRGIIHTITADDLPDIPKICPVLRIPLFLDGKTSPRDNWVSLDRIDSRQGYVPGNVEFISWRANTLKKNATSEEMKLMAEYYVMGPHYDNK